MISISMRWNIARHDLLSSALLEIQNTGCTTVEACGLNEAMSQEFCELVAQGKIQARSVHNPCPDASNQQRTHLWPGDWLASSDPEKFSLALLYAQKTIDFAKVCGIRYMVLHLGRVEIEPCDESLAELVQQTGNNNREYQSRKGAYQIAREAKSPFHLDIVRRCLDTLLAYSDGSVILCLENRYRFDQIPSFQDIGIFLEEYCSSPISVWYDTGHAHAQVHLGLAEESHLQPLRSFISGTHLHDACGVDDHKAPGTGEIDFKALAQILPERTIHVMELDPTIHINEVRASAQYLYTHGFH